MVVVGTANTLPDSYQHPLPIKKPVDLSCSHVWCNDPWFSLDKILKSGAGLVLYSGTRGSG